MTEPTDDISREELDSYLQMLEIANDPSNYDFELEQAILEMMEEDQPDDQKEWSDEEIALSLS